MSKTQTLPPRSSLTKRLEEGNEGQAHQVTNVLAYEKCYGSTEDSQPAQAGSLGKSSWRG